MVEPVFLVHDAVLVPDEHIEMDRGVWSLTTERIIMAVNAASRSGSALVEAHNHGGQRPRFSRTDLEMLPEFSDYVLGSLPNRPYAATVWGDSTIYGKFFMPDGGTGILDSTTVNGDRLRQTVSRNDDGEFIPAAFDRQLPWFTPDGQRALGRVKISVVGAGGTGSQIIQNLTFLGIRDFVLIDHDTADETNMNRLVTATAADVGAPKTMIGRRFVKSVAPNARVVAVQAEVRAYEALDALKGVDAMFGCVDNDAPRLILNELALAYGIPYFDLAVGIDAEGGKVTVAGGRVTVVSPGGPCLNCMGEIDAEEARFFLSDEQDRDIQVARGYVTGLDALAPSVVSLNAAVAATATNEFAVFVSGLRAANPYTELDLLGTGSAIQSQWLVPTRVPRLKGCIHCSTVGIGDAAEIDKRYARDP